MRCGAYDAFGAAHLRRERKEEGALQPRLDVVPPGVRKENTTTLK